MFCFSSVLGGVGCFWTGRFIVSVLVVLEFIRVLEFLEFVGEKLVEFSIEFNLVLVFLIKEFVFVF